MAQGLQLHRFVSIRPTRRAVGWLLTALIASLLAGGTASAGTILIDFNDASTAGFGWNTFHAGNDGTTQGLIWDDGTASGISLTLPTFNDSGNPGWNPGNPLPSWAPASVASTPSLFRTACAGCAAVCCALRGGPRESGSPGALKRAPLDATRLHASRYHTVSLEGRGRAPYSTVRSPHNFQ